MSHLGTIILIISITIIVNVYYKLTKKRNKIYTCLNGKTVVIIAADPGNYFFLTLFDSRKIIV